MAVGFWGARGPELLSVAVLCVCGQGEQVATSRAVLPLRALPQVDRPILPIQLAKQRREALPVKPLQEKI